MSDPMEEPREFGRRLAAARGYDGRDGKRWANEVLKKDRGTLRRYEEGEVEDAKRPWLIETYARETELPKEFFVIDFKDLPEMVAAWQQVQDRASTPEEMVAQQEKDEAASLPPDPSESPNVERGP